MLPKDRKKFAQRKTKADVDGKKEEADTARDPPTRSAPIVDPRKAVTKFAKATLMEKGAKGVAIEFGTMPRTISPDAAKTFYSNNPKSKNRYKDVACLDNSRVKLRDYGDNDYVHANFVSTPTNEKRFICAQAPLETTCCDFWFMVLQERVENILMLCNMEEAGKKKCSEYFPTEKNEEIKFDDFSVRCTRRTTFEFQCKTPVEVKETSLEVEYNGKKQKVKHYHWVDWPDRGVPPADMAVIELLNKMCGSKYPIVVHCSAGVGRTGAVVLIQYMLEMVLSGEALVDCAVLLKKLRAQRGNSIQTVDQYLFVHVIVLLHWFEKQLLDKTVEPLLNKFVDESRDLRKLLEAEKNKK